MILAVLLLAPVAGSAARLTTYYFDADGDGYGNPTITQKATSPPPGYVAQGGDCNDADPAINPDAADICGDVIDQNCSGGDQACSAGKGNFYFYRDADLDGYGDPNAGVTAKNRPAGYVSNKLDCNDGAASINPAAAEICDGADNDCNAGTADGSGTSAPFNTLQGGVCSGSRQVCAGGAWTDAYGGVSGYEAVEASCDTLDNDCDAQTDEGLTGTFYRDADADSFGNAAEPASACSAPAGYVANADDCNDSDSQVNPSAADICGDGIDQNCDGADAACPAVTFETTYGGTHRDWTRNVEQTPDGGYIMAGYEYYTVNQQVFTTLYAIKTDEYGNQVWNQSYPDRQYDYGRVVIHRTPDGGYAIIGTGWNSVTIKQEMFLLKIDSAGAKEWIRHYGSTGAGSGFDFKPTSDGGFIMVGEKFTNELKGDVVLVKADASGATTWSTIFSYAAYERANSVIETSDGGYALLGYTQSFGAGYDDVYLVKTNSQGVEEWHRTYGTTGWEQGNALRQTSDGGYILAGMATPLYGQANVYLIKTDQSGAPEWTRTFGGSLTDAARDVRQTSDGGYVFIGYTDSFGQDRYAYDYYLIKVDPGGTEEWSKVLGGPGAEVGEGVEPTADGGYAVIGTTNSIGAGDYDIWLVKLDAEGNSRREFWLDADGDGYGDSTQSVVAIDPPPGYVELSTDCNDSDSAIRPGAAEVPDDGIDQNCDGQDASVYYRDFDSDGYGNIGDSVVAASQPAGYVVDNTDCNDLDLATHPGAEEICADGIDQDCDGHDLEVCLQVYFRDADGDGFGDPVDSFVGFPPPPEGYVADGTDCNDANSGVHPGATEVPADGIDQNCDGVDPPLAGTFLKTIGGARSEYGYTVTQTSDGGFFLAGVSDSFTTGMELYAVKTDRYGVAEWSNHYGGYGSDYPVSGRPTLDGGYVLLGTGFASGLSDQFLLIKLDAGGAVVWSRTYGGSEDEHGRDVRETPDGGFAIFGEGRDAYGMLDFVLTKTDANGNQQWTRSYGGTDYDQGRSMALTADGGYILVGHTRSFGAGSADMYLVKVDASGNPQWSRTFGGSAWDEGFSVEQATDGGYVAFGYTSSFGAGGNDMYLVKTDASGNQQWSRTYGGGNGDFGWCARQTGDGGYALLGYSSSFSAADDMYLVKTDPAGGVIWSRTIDGGGADIGLSLDLTEDGGYVLLGRTNSYGAGGYDFLLVKTDADGNY